MKKASILILIAMLVLIGCSKQEPLEPVENPLSIQLKEPVEVAVYENHPLVVISFSDYDPIFIELYPEIAKNTVDNFIQLIQEEFYDGLIFYKSISGFMIQTGDPLNNGTGGPGYQIEGEFSKEGEPFSQYLSHTRGTLSMARGEELDSAGSQFFIVHEDQKDLDLVYAAFGRVIKGIETVDLIANQPADENGVPEDAVEILSIQVELNGYEHQAPKIIE